MATLDARNRANEKYRKRMIKQYLVKFNKKYDEEIINHIEAIEGSKNAYFRQLVLNDIKKNKNE